MSKRVRYGIKFAAITLGSATAVANFFLGHNQRAVIFGLFALVVVAMLIFQFSQDKDTSSKKLQQGESSPNKLIAEQDKEQLGKMQSSTWRAERPEDIYPEKKTRERILFIIIGITVLCIAGTVGTIVIGVQSNDYSVFAVTTVLIVLSLLGVYLVVRNRADLR